MSNEAKPEAVDHPAHYGGKESPFEAIKIIEGLSLGFHAGNTLKYLIRYKHKGTPIQDLEKARWYLDRLIQIEKEEASQ